MRLYALHSLFLEKSMSARTLAHTLKISNNLVGPLLTTALVSTGISALALPAQAQTDTATPTPQSITLCEYDASSGFPNPLASNSSLDGGRAISAIQAGEASLFVYEEFPAIVVRLSPEPEDPVAANPWISSVRSLTMSDMPLADARQRLVAEPEYYAQLLGLSDVESLGGKTFAEVDQTLICKETTEIPDGISIDQTMPDEEATPPATEPPAATPPAAAPPAIEPPAAEPPAAEPPAPAQPSLSDLPDGNYRVTSADLPFRVIDTEELLTSGGSVFLFGKTGDNVVGTFGYPETDNSVCIEGTLAGNIVTGQAFSQGTEGTIPDDDVLTLGEPETEGEGFSALLNLEAFSRINAGSSLPRTDCQ